MGKLWGGRFTGDIDAPFDLFNASYSFDKRLFEADVVGSQAYAKGLHKAGILDDNEHQTLQDALAALLEKGRTDQAFIDQGVTDGVEDIHSFVESALIAEVGDVGRKLHTGRSRNDQVATDIRLYLRDAIEGIKEQLTTLSQTLIEKAEAHPEAALPGYTHLQKAQPILLAHYLLSYVEMFLRDRDRLTDVHKRVNILPLGSAAMAGTNYPIDRHFLAETLGFDDITYNSMDAVSDRDFVLEFLNAANLIMMHMSRLSEDLIIYASTEFKFVSMSDQVSTGSSIMPQKKNPDALELIRGKMGRVVGAYTTLSTVLKGLPLCYNKDLQEDKEPLFDAIDTVSISLEVMNTVIATMIVHEEHMNHSASRDYLSATELADYLARKKLPFREAHEVVGRVVLGSIDQGKQLDELTLEEYKAYHPLFEEDIFDAISLKSTLSRKDVPGGTAPNRVTEAIEHAKKRL